MSPRRPAGDSTTITAEIGLSPRRTPTLRLPAVPPASAPAPAAVVAPGAAPVAMTWAPAPRRTRPGRAPLTGVAAVVGRYLQRHIDERRDDTLTAVAVASVLNPEWDAREVQRAADRLLSTIRSLRDEGTPWLRRVDAPCETTPACGARQAQGPVGMQDELCEEHWVALGGWWAVQAVHVRTLMRLAA